jgi:formylglycine-generating enzyme required for sulfatase activity
VEHPAEGEVKWLSFVTGYLRPAIKHGAVDLWVDRLMPGGGDYSLRVLRGGSFANKATAARSSARFRYDQDVWYYANGFRVARDLD